MSSNETRLSLQAAIEADWPFFFGLVTVSAFLAVFPEFAQHMVVASTLLASGAFITAWPCFKKRAPYSFWVVGVVIWFFSCIGFVALIGLIE